MGACGWRRGWRLGGAILMGYVESTLLSGCRSAPLGVLRLGLFVAWRDSPHSSLAIWPAPQTCRCLHAPADGRGRGAVPNTLPGPRGTSPMS